MTSYATRMLSLGLAGAMMTSWIPAAWGAPPTVSREVEKKIMDVLDDLDRNQRRGNMNVPVSDGRLLRLLAQATRAQRVVEIGTSNGYSGIWICLGLLGTGGKLTTFELDAGRAALARENFKRAGVERIVTLIQGDAHQKVLELTEPIDILWIDADKEGYIDYFNKLLPRVRPGGLILAHNTTNARSGMEDYIEAVTKHPDLETLFLHVDERGMGVSLKKRSTDGQKIPGDRSPSRNVEKKIQAVIDDLNAHQRTGNMNVPADDGRLLRVLTHACRTKHFVEIGTSNGNSGTWICLALLATGGKLTTHELDAGRADLARENFKRTGVDRIITLVQGDAHEEVTKITQPIDILFLDADKQGYIDYFNKLLPRMRVGGLILAHNTTNLRSGMADYIKAVTTHPDLETIFLHEKNQGMGVTLVKRTITAVPAK